MSTLHFQKINRDEQARRALRRSAALGSHAASIFAPHAFVQRKLYVDRDIAREFEWTENATVLAVGNGKRGEDGVRVPITSVKVGDRIAFSYKPAHEKKQLEALFGKGVRLIELGDIDALIGTSDAKNVRVSFDGVEMQGHIDGTFIEVQRELEPNGKCLNGDCPCHVGLDCLTHDAATTPFEKC